MTLIEFKLPEIGENVRSGTVTRVLVASGRPVAKEQGVVEVETDKAAIEIPSTVAGTVRDVRVKPGDTVAPGQVLFTVESAAPAAGTPAPAPEPAPAARPALSPAPAEARPPQAAEEPASQAPGVAPPSVRRFARESGVDLGRVRGTGGAGRITLADVTERSRAGQRPSAAPRAAAAGPALPDFAKWGPVERQALGSVRRVTAEHMATAWSNIPHVTQHDTADITALEKLRKERSSGDLKLTVTSLALKIVAAALKRFPQFNASLDPAAGELVLKRYIHIGVAVDTDRGLLVPVLRDADKKGVAELSRELAEAARKARERKLGLAELQGGTFTITNLGGIGGTSFSPIVNWPEVAILGMSRSALEPRWVDDAFRPRLILPLSLSYDHRVIDGADAARFLRFVCEALEEPMALAFEGA
ncbi:MAG: 2-oxo acid dehydrogenase subunit E2 [Elusimicrobia bacterium]|nr:2-oxo acid dehydrogenase subunit E2 [Elusimicrobiota bacterium]